MTDNKCYKGYTSFLEERYGYRVYRIGVDAGFSCPNRFGKSKEGGCAFCDAMGARAMYLRSSESSYKRNSGFEEKLCARTSDAINEQDITDQIHKGASFIRKRYGSEHFSLYFQSFSNTFAPVETLERIYSHALSVMPFEELIVSTRPDCIDEKKAALLASYKGRVKNVMVELGLQSGSDKILKAMNRGHDVKCLIDASRIVKASGLELTLHVLLGYPGETYADIQKTVDVINTVMPDNIKIHNLNVVSGTKLYEDYLKGEVTSSCARRHIENTVYILRRISPEIVIERLICETPGHRLASPREFPEKNRYLIRLDKYMNENNYKQGDLYKI